MHPMVLKKCASLMAYPLILIFRKSIQEKKIPYAWREQNIGLFLLISIFRKVLEELLRDELMGFLIINKLNAYEQHG